MAADYDTCPLCQKARHVQGCTADRCNAQGGGYQWPWRWDDAGRLCDAYGNPIELSSRYWRVTAPMLPELDQLVRAVAAARTVGDLRKLRAWVDAVVKRLDEARVVGDGA